MNIESLAAQLNVPGFVIQRYENEELPKSWEAVMTDIPSLAAALQCSPEYLMGWEHESPEHRKELDIFAIAIDIADRTGFDRLVMSAALDNIKKTDGLSVYRKMFDPDFYHVLNAHAREIQTKQNISSIQKSFALLDVEGQKEAVKRVEELTKIPKYRRTDE